MTEVSKVRAGRPKSPSREGISLAALVDRLGERAAYALFSRIDSSQRDGTTIVGRSVRDARSGFNKAHADGCAQVVVPGRAVAGRDERVDTSDELLIIKMADLEAVVRAGQEPHSWLETFAPRKGLEAATTSPKLKRGSRGRRLLQA